MDFEVHTLDSAPAEAQDTLRAIKSKYGFIPNLLGLMASAPPVMKAYGSLGELFSQTSLSAVEQQVVLISVSVFNRCEYCVAAHSTEAKNHKRPEQVLQALREGKPIEDKRLESLRLLSEEIVESRGWPEQSTIDRFVKAGFEPSQVLEVILGVTMKTLSNFTNHLADTPLDQSFEKMAWSAP